MISPYLLPGDCLLYKPSSLFGQIIRIKTWHNVAHCEVYAGNAASWASRDGLGVASYPLRTDQLVYVLRPTVPLNLTAATAWATSVSGTKYGWLELLNFVGLPINAGGMFCSQFLTEYYRHAGWTMFIEDPPSRVAPFEFLNLVGAGFTDVSTELV